MCLMFVFLRTIWLKNFFWKIWVEFKFFWKSFNPILMHFIHETLCFEEGVLALNCFVFQKSEFSKFSSNRSCCLTNRKCDKNWVWICWLDWCSIDARSIEYVFRLIEAYFRAIEIWSEGVFKKSFLTCSL